MCDKYFGREIKRYAVTLLLKTLQIEELKAELLKSQSSSKEYSSKLATYVKQLEEKDNKLKKLHSERHKHLEEVFEMK